MQERKFDRAVKLAAVKLAKDLRVAAVPAARDPDFHAKLAQMVS